MNINTSCRYHDYEYRSPFGHTQDDYEHALFSELLSMRVERYESEHGPLTWTRASAFVLIRDDFTCAYCGDREQAMTVDHLIPKDIGGGDAHHNLVCACRNCNGRKSTKLEFTDKYGNHHNVLDYVRGGGKQHGSIIGSRF